MSANEGVVRGMQCPRCGDTRMEVGKTVRMPGDRIKRYRYCASCHRGVTTIEMTLARWAARGIHQ